MKNVKIYLFNTLKFIIDWILASLALLGIAVLVSIIIGFLLSILGLL